MLIGCQSLSGIAVQSVVGNWVDESHRKRLLTAVAGVVVALGAVGIVILPNYYTQIVVQIVIGLAVTIFPAATAAFALGMTKEDGAIRGRVARNETFTHTGNVAFAIAAGAVGTLLALQGIFIAAAVFAAGMAPAVFFIEEEKVDYEAARGGSQEQSGDEKKERRGWRDWRVTSGS